ncbi:MAG: CHAT domain-containing protein, partial [Planctomycetota bacterium]|nr:CHAT domain-containing protein [Planctomycetota bacterium]
MRIFRLSMLLTTLWTTLVNGDEPANAPTVPEDIAEFVQPLPMSGWPELKPLFADDFSKNTLDQYVVKGNVKWSAGKVTLEPGSSLTRKFEAGAWCEFELDLQFPELTQVSDESATVLELSFEGASPAIIEWSSRRTKQGTTSQIRIGDTLTTDVKTELVLIRETTTDTPLKSGHWVVRYRYGATSIEFENVSVLEGYLQNDTAELRACRMFAVESVTEVAGCQTHGSMAAQLHSEEEQAELARARLLKKEAGKLYSAGKSREAVAIARDSLVIQRQVLGEQHPDYSISLSNLVEVYRAMGDYARAEPLAVHSLDIKRKVLGEQHPDYSTGLNNLGVLYMAMGDHPRAMPLLVQAPDITKNAFGDQHPDYALRLNNLAQLYIEMGNHAWAEPLLIQARVIRKRALGEQHPSYAFGLNDLAFLYKETGDYARAEPLYVEALSIYKNELGEQHPHYADSLNNLAGLYKAIGDYARAEPLLIQARDISKKALGVQHPRYALSLNNLAELYCEMGKNAQAERLLIQARDIMKDTLGEQHPQFALSLNNLAGLYLEIEDLARAELLYIQARDINQTSLGEQHPSYATSLNNLAVLYREMGDYARAELLYCQARDIRKAALGEQHPNYAHSLNNLASLHLYGGEFDVASQGFRSGLKISRQQIEVTIAILSEQQQRTLVEELRAPLSGLTSVAVQSAPQAREAFAEALLWKGDNLVRQRGVRLAAGDPAIAELFKELQSVSARTAGLLRKTPDPEPRDIWMRQLDDLTAKREMLEKQLMEQSAAFRKLKERITLEQLLAALPTDAVLVDFWEFNLYRPAEAEGKPAPRPERSYMAYVVKRSRDAERGGDVEAILLGPAEPIEDAVEEWRVSFGQTASSHSAGERLKELVWKPIEERLNSAKTVILCPDRALSRIPFGALPGKDAGTYLIEEYRLACIPVPQLLPDLMQRADQAKRLKGDLLLIGDVDYSSDSTIALTTTEKKPRRRDVDDVLSEMQFTPLDETAGEIATIKELYEQVFEIQPDSIHLLRKAAATEAAFRLQAPKHELLHVATHGFFADPSLLSNETAAASEDGSRGGLFGADTRMKRFVKSYSPGLLSGLALAGANRKPQNEEDDGILTAEEIAYLPLEGVELV